MGDIITEWMMDPDNRTKVYFAFNIGLILVNILISVGALILVLKILEYV